MYSWEMAGNDAKSVLQAMEETHLKQDHFDVNDILDMEFFREEEVKSGDTAEVASTPVAASAPWSPEIRKKKQKVSASQPSTYPRASQKKPVNFATLRDSPSNQAKQKKTFWYNTKLKSEGQAAAPSASTQGPEIVVTFPLLNLKASTAITAPLEQAVKVEEDMEAFQPPHSYYFDPRTQPFYYPSSCQPVSSTAGQSHQAIAQAPRFQLVEQPGSRQRKSYKNENR